MKMPTMNFDFGPFTEPGVVALSPYGIAVRSSKGEYLTYNAATGATVDVTGFTFDFQKMPAAIKDLRAGDMVLHRGKPMYVQSVEEDGIHCIDILNSENKVIVPVIKIIAVITSGLSFADNFGEAAAILESTYGEMLKSIKNLEFIHDDQNVITLPRDIIRDYIDGGKFVNEIPCDSEGRELATLNQNASKANDNW